MLLWCEKPNECSITARLFRLALLYSTREATQQDETTEAE